ncbi:hypothetical protein CDAR_525931 [Caerostris darwini]|uniref:Uncharacterized protein n=1 Tax=Caerostris darwini TaxID=1538125 RepID=A0AAV4S7K6_9ARAC|nr:hypothetical protein CDAR_525931 [Caerostris darwini]
MSRIYYEHTTSSSFRTNSNSQFLPLSKQVYPDDPHRILRSPDRPLKRPSSLGSDPCLFYEAKEKKRALGNLNAAFRCRLCKGVTLR